MIRDVRSLAGDASLRFVVALGEPGPRARAVAHLRAEIGAQFTSIIDPGVLIGASSRIGAGAVILGHSSITTDARLGEHVLVNPGCTVAHDDVLEDFATLSPGVHLAGHVRVEEGAFLGTGACVIPRMRIGAHAVVGAGAVVIPERGAGPDGVRQSGAVPAARLGGEGPASGSPPSAVLSGHV